MQSTPPHHPCEALRRFQTFGWTPRPHLSTDDNFLDLVLILTRNSICREGGMGCIFTKTITTTNEEATTAPAAAQDSYDSSRFYDRILGVATNQPLYTPNESDVHAEIAALGQSARRGHATEGCTVYITMPPCKRCLAALVVAGVHRWVFFRRAPQYLRDMAQKHNLEVVERDHSSERNARVEALISQYYLDHNMDEQEEIAKARKQRKQDEKERKQKRKLAALERKSSS